MLPLETFHRRVGLCLRFSYLMLSRSTSSLKVIFKEPKQEKPVLVWQLGGYHGTKWLAAQVTLSGAKEAQVGEETYYSTFRLDFLL